MAHWRSLQDKLYIGSWDLVDRDGKTPRDWTMKIKKVESGAVKTAENPKGKREVLIRFEGATKPFICNSTNAKTIAAMYGDDVDAWTGKAITLYQTDVPKGREMIRGVRVRPRPPTGKAETIVEREPDPEIRDAQNKAFDRPASGDPADEFQR